MGNIRLLPDLVASQVAAGEVVERPASIVKELVENSLDAGARRVEVEIARGGVASIIVRDDGCGMDHDDALLCLERHATSKIREVGDLVGVRTMGFRGEALPSIASVSRFRILTRARDAASGTEVRVAGGRVESVREAGAAPGTLIEARDLFFNVPARRKFLRGEATEAAHIQQTLELFAIANPSIALAFRKDGRTTLDLPAAISIKERLRDLFGAAFLERLLPVPDREHEGVRLRGFVGRPGEGRRDRQQQYVVVNGRPVMSPEVAGALREAYAGHLPAGLQPLAVLMIELNGRDADCNAHPAKKVVRFSRPEVVRRAVFDAAGVALRPAPEMPPPAEPAPPRLQTTPFRPAPEPELRLNPPLPEDGPPTIFHHPVARPSGSPPAPTSFRFLASMARDYLAFEGPEGLVLMDRAAAAQRIAFERLMRQMERGAAPCQQLMLPEVFELPAREHAWVIENAPALREAGFMIEAFGGTSVKVEGVPAMAEGRDARALLHEVAAAMRAAGRLPRGAGLRDLVAKSVCRAAGPSATLENPETLLETLLRCELPYATPHGAPTMIQYSFAELDRRFGKDR